MNYYMVKDLRGATFSLVEAPTREEAIKVVRPDARDSDQISATLIESRGRAGIRWQGVLR